MAGVAIAAPQLLDVAVVAVVVILPVVGAPEAAAGALA